MWQSVSREDCPQTAESGTALRAPPQWSRGSLLRGLQAYALSRRLKNGHLGFSLRYASWLAAYETFDFLLVLRPAVGVWHDLSVRIGPGSTGIVRLLRGRRALSQTGACVAFRGAGFDERSHLSQVIHRIRGWFPQCLTPRTHLCWNRCDPHPETWP